MKNLATCTPTEFFKQTILIKRKVEAFLTNDDIREIRARLPKDIREITNDMTPKEKGEIMVQNQKAKQEQITKNFLAILEILMDKNADQTLELLALCCFVDPAKVDDYKVSEYLGAIADLLEDENVLRFFSSLARLEQTNISIVSKK